ncbi:MAG: N-6 DNA methylase [Ignavibacteriae bacterium]|nr:N-6 DNA methylase [Ignavibacteriota bacterium]
MNQEQIKKLEKELWDSADQLRANSKLTAAEYKDPVLGLVLLRFAQNRYEEVKAILESRVSDGPRPNRNIAKDKYLAEGAIMLPEEAKYDYLANLPESNDIAEAINNAMKLIEKEYPDLSGILPKSYQEFESQLLRDLIRVFNKDAVKKATGDVFGRIYEYFLMKFSMQGAGAQEGGEFFTPPSLVQLIVHFIEPDHGIIHDPACGSAGMFVQTGYFVRNHTNKIVNEAIKCYGTELKTNNYKLAKINLAIHGIEGNIIERNSFYSDPHNLIGKCDFVMTNPPFNVNKIDKNKDYVKNDPRLPFGLPKADNGNYMWIQYFYSYLNDKGRAGFVMASSATDAGHSERAIRKELIETKHVDCVVSIGNNFFYTRSLPCHLWFFDKGKRKENDDKILMIDARNIYRKVTTTINDFSPGQLLNLTTIMKMYRGEKDVYTNTIKEHEQILYDYLDKMNEDYKVMFKDLIKIGEECKVSLKINEIVKINKPSNYTEAQIIFNHYYSQIESVSVIISQWQEEISKVEKNIAEKQTDEKDGKKQIALLRSNINKLNKPIVAFYDATKESAEQIKQGIKDWHDFVVWFPDKIYRDIEGLCKIITIEETKDNEYSLTPGRYVGIKIQIEEDFDYTKRVKEISQLLSDLNDKSNLLLEAIKINEKQFL